MHDDESNSGLKTIKRRRGYFGKYEIYGEWFEDRFGERFWLMRMISAHANHSLRVSGEEFRRAHEDIDLSGERTIVRGQIGVDLDLAAKEAAQNAIEKWEGEPPSS